LEKSLSRLTKLKILFLTKYPIAGASSRYRVYQYLPYLRSKRHYCQVSSFYSDRDFALIYQKGKLIFKLWMVAKGFLRRIKDALLLFRFDLVYMQREALPFGPLWFERICQLFKIKMIFDYDDALFIFKPSSSTPMSDKFKRPQRIPNIFSRVDCVFAGNAYLKQQALQYCQCAKTMYVAEDLSKITPRADHHNNDKLIIGWLGSPSTEKYLEFVREPIEKLVEHFPKLELLIIGGGQFKSEHITVRHEKWTLEGEDQLLKQFTVGIMPLPDEEWSKGKSGGKARTYMASMIPAVCMDIGFNQTLIAHGHTGFLVKSNLQWFETLTRLLSDHGLRQNIAMQALTEVKQKYSLTVLAPVFEQYIEEVING
jgi:glycosyltransferase involved in cell wall biosynthesis